MTINGRQNNTGHKNQHFWEIVGEDVSEQGRGELEWCGLCQQFRWDDGEPFKMDWKEVERMEEVGELEPQ